MRSTGVITVAHNGSPDLTNPAQSSEIVHVTPELAREWLDTAMYDRQRGRRAEHVKFLAEAMKRGTFKLSTIEFWHLDGRWHLIDGQHRLAAIVSSGVTIPLNILRETTDSPEALAQAYSTTDIGIPRTFMDAYRAWGLADSLGLTESQVRILGAATVHLLTNFRSSPGVVVKLRDVRVESARTWAPIARDAFALFAGTPRRFHRSLTSGGVFAIVLVTLQFQRDRAFLFWQSVAAREGLAKGTPEYTLAEYLSEHGVAEVRPNVYARAVAGCWNAYFENRSLKLARVNDANAPIVIRGTPFNGKLA